MVGILLSYYDLLGRLIFRGYVSFREGRYPWNSSVMLRVSHPMQAAPPLQCDSQLEVQSEILRQSQQSQDLFRGNPTEPPKGTQNYPLIPLKCSFGLYISKVYKSISSVVFSYIFDYKFTIGRPLFCSSFSLSHPPTLPLLASSLLPLHPAQSDRSAKGSNLRRLRKYQGEATILFEKTHIITHIAGSYVKECIGGTRLHALEWLDVYNFGVYLL